MLDKPMTTILRLDWEKTLYIILIILALSTRLWGLGDRVQSHDESLHTKFSWDLYAGRGFSHTPLMHGPFLFHVTALSYFLFDDNDFTARLPVALMGIAIVAFPYFLRRWLGRAGALVTSFLLLISPSISYYSRYIRHDIPIILWTLIAILAVFSYLRDGRDRWLYFLAAAVSLMFATKEVAFIYAAIIGIFLVGIFLIQAWQREWTNENLKPLLLIALGLAAVGMLILGLGILFRPEEQAVLAWWAIAGAILAGLAGAATAAFVLIGVWRDLHSFRVFDLLIVLGTLCLPFLSPLAIQLAGLDPMAYTAPTIYYSGAIAGVFLLASVAIGLAWDWRRWSTASAIHYAIFIVLFTTVFTNGTGIASGMVGSLGYWLAQQEVQRGGQPWFYYFIMVPLYEFLPLILTLIAPFVLILWPKRRRSNPLNPFPESVDSDPAPQPANSTESNPSNPFSKSVDSNPLLESVDSQRYFIPFLLWWIAVAWIAYSYAGEKMPWLTVHLALPMIMLSGWLIGRLIEAIDWRQLARRRAWLLALVAPPFVVATVMLLDAALAGPFGGVELNQLNVTGEFLGALLGVLAFGGGLAYLIWRTGWRRSVQVLLLVALLLPILLTIRTAWRFNYVLAEYPLEFLVYAHAGPAVKETMRQIEELSRRTAGGPQLIKVAFGADGSWPFHWYLRDYPNATFYGENPSREQMDAPVVIAGRSEWDAVTPYVANDYLVNTYNYLWWPMEDYRELNWERFKRMITDPQARAAVWDIWYDRDFQRYDELRGKKHTLDEWPLRSDYRLYIRRDVASQLWDLGTTGPQEALPEAPYAEGWRDLGARLVFGEQGAAPGQLQNPRGIKIGPDGNVYVADSGNHRLQKFTPDGELIAAWGQNSTVEMETGAAQGFNEPWDVAVAPDGSLLVADTWNHRVQKLDPQGRMLTAWGLFGQYGPDDPQGVSAFYGPRGVSVSPDGLTYVADTGNKRIQVFDENGGFVFQWGGGGVVEGFLDEPVGVTVGPEGNVYVADTWNRRVQVFDRDGSFLRQWPIEGWDTGLPEEKPYLAVDDAGHVYVTDPGHYRVLIFDSQGNYLLSFGQYGLDERSFALPIGVAVAPDGSVYVTDAQGGRILVFDPIQLPAAQP
jgi:uncharacterized protein (TIGR03663 family)